MAILRTRYLSNASGTFVDLSTDPLLPTPETDINSGGVDPQKVRLFEPGDDAVVQQIVDLTGDLLFNDIAINNEIGITNILFNEGIFPLASGSKFDASFNASSVTIQDGKIKISTGIFDQATPTTFNVSTEISDIATSNFYRRDLIEAQIVADQVQLTVVTGSEVAAAPKQNTQIDRTSATTFVLYSVLLQEDGGGTTNIIAVDRVADFLGFNQLIEFKKHIIPTSGLAGIFNLRKSGALHLRDSAGVLLPTTVPTAHITVEDSFGDVTVTQTGRTSLPAPITLPTDTYTLVEANLDDFTLTTFDPTTIPADEIYLDTQSGRLAMNPNQVLPRELFINYFALNIVTGELTTDEVVHKDDDNNILTLNSKIEKIDEVLNRGFIKGEGITYKSQSILQDETFPPGFHGESITPLLLGAGVNINMGAGAVWNLAGV